MAKKTVKTIRDLDAFKPHLQSIEQCDILLQHAQSVGKEIPQHILQQHGEIHAVLFSLNQSIQKGDTDIDPQALNLALIGTVHYALSKVVAPASPNTVFLMHKNKKSGLFGMMGPVPLVRRLNFITLLCIGTFLALFYASGEHAVNSYSINGDILSYEGLKFVYNELVIVCLAALGSCFYALFEVYRYISKDSYDPKYDSIYWIRFLLGIVSGVVLAQFIFVSPEILGTDNANTAPASELTAFITYKPLLAFLGGFSARAVHKILNALIEAIETFISGSARDMIRQKEQAVTAKMNQKIAKIELDNQQKQTTNRLQSSAKLLELKDAINQNKQQDVLTNKLNELLNEWLAPMGAGIQFDKAAGNIPVGHAIPFNPQNANNVAVEKDIQDYEIPEFPKDLDNKAYIESKDKTTAPPNMN